MKAIKGGGMMPAVSENQRQLACIALSIKQGKTKTSYSEAAAEMAKSMTEEELRHYCEAPVKKE